MEKCERSGGGSFFKIPEHEKNEDSPRLKRKKKIEEGKRQKRENTKI